MIDCPECLDSGCPPGARRFECPVCGGSRHPWPEATEVELLRNQILSWSEGYEDSESPGREMTRKQLARLERLIAAVRQETAEDLRLAARLFRNAANMYRQLEMDTPEDQTLHSRAVASLDSGADSLEKRASSIEAGVRQEITALALGQGADRGGGAQLPARRRKSSWRSYASRVDHRRIGGKLR